MTAIPAPRIAARHASRPAVRRLSRAATVRLLAVACAALYTAALTLPWLRADLGAPLRAGELALQLPGLGRPAGASWAVVVIVLAAVHAAVAVVPGRYQAPVALTGAALSLTAVCGFLLLGAFADYALQQHLLDGQATLDAVRRIVGYRIPRPTVTTLGPVELPPGAAPLVSALRAGFLLAVVAAAFSAGLWTLTRRGWADGRGAPVPVRWAARGVVLALGVLGLLMAAQAWWAGMLSERAATELAAGRAAAARAAVDAALGVNATLRARPDVQQVLGDTAMAGETRLPAQQLYGQSLLLKDAGRHDEALGLAVRAAAADPAEQSYADTVCRLAADRAQSASGIDVVRSLVPVSQRCDLALLQLAASELAAGRYDLVPIDAGQLSRQTPDRDLRSAALTELARARLATGDLVGGRTLLQQALASDPDDLNVVARALASGLYSAGG